MGATPNIVRLNGEPTRVELEVSAPRAGFLVLNDTYFPGWQARVDGVAAPIFRTNFFVRGVVVPAGTRRVVFEYRPLSLALGATLSGLGLLLLFWIGLRFDWWWRFIGGGAR